MQIATLYNIFSFDSHFISFRFISFHFISLINYYTGIPLSQNRITLTQKANTLQNIFLLKNYSQY